MGIFGSGPKDKPSSKTGEVAAPPSIDTSKLSPLPPPAPGAVAREVSDTDAQFVPVGAKRRRAVIVVGVVGLLGLAAVGAVAAITRDTAEQVSTDAAEPAVVDEVAAEPTVVEQSTEEAAEDDADTADSNDADDPADAADEGDEEQAGAADDPEAQPTGDDAADPTDETATDETGTDETANDETATDGDSDGDTAAESVDEGEANDAPAEDTFDPSEPVVPSMATVRSGQIFFEGAVPTKEAGDAIVEMAVEILGPDNVFDNYFVDPRAGAPDVSNITVEDTINFEASSAVLVDPDNPLLAQGAALMTFRPEMTVTIIGHTDNEGTPAINDQLSLDRAETIKAFLVSQGIDPARIATQGAGSSEPIASNDTVEGRARNRRIQVFLENVLIEA